jgi:hypothetical protein
MSYEDKRIDSNNKNSVFKQVGIKQNPGGDPKKRGSDKFGVGGKIERTGNDVMVHKNER